VFLELADGSRAVVTLRELRLHRNDDGFAVATRIHGDVAWGGGDVEGINVDKLAVAAERKWQPIETFDDVLLGAPGDGPRFQFDTLRFRTMTANGLHMLITSSMRGCNGTCENITGWAGFCPCL
jgi:hypothetical protein